MALIASALLERYFLFECDTCTFYLWGLLDLVVLNCLRYCLSRLFILWIVCILLSEYISSDIV